MCHRVLNAKFPKTSVFSIYLGANLIEKNLVFKSGASVWIRDVRSDPGTTLPNYPHLIQTSTE